MKIAPNSKQHLETFLIGIRDKSYTNLLSRTRLLDRAKYIVNSTNTVKVNPFTPDTRDLLV